MQQPLKLQQVILNYQLLSSDDESAKSRANRFLMSLVHRQQSWIISRELIIKQNDPNYQVLGSQILYQKLAMELQTLPVDHKLELRDFAFNLLQDQSLVFIPLIDKIASISALLACTLLLEHWPTFVDDLLSFMLKSPNCLKNGLFVLERIPEELRLTNRLAPGYKKVIIDEFLKNQQRILNIFQEVLKMAPDSVPPALYKQLIKRNLMAMESWSQSGFNFLKYPFIMKQVLTQSLQDLDKLEHAIVVVVETIKSGPANRQTKTLTHKSPSDELKSYSEDQISSIKIIMQYVEENCHNFANKSNIQTEHLQAFLDIIKQSLLNFSFLMMEPIGFNLLQIIKHYTNSSDLRVSSNTFEFWIDMSEKMSTFYGGSTSTFSQDALARFSHIIDAVFEIVSSKVIVEIDEMLDDPDLKEDATFDDPSAVTFTQYRKESTIFYQYIYNFFLTTTKSPNYYFEKCFSLIAKDLQKPNTENVMVNKHAYQFHKFTQLALFCIKCAQESMFSKQDAENVRKTVRFVLQKVESGEVVIRARVCGEILLLVSECTTQIKNQNDLLFLCLKFALKHILDQKLCFFCAGAFKSIIDALETGIQDHNFLDYLIEFYNNHQLPREIIVGDMLEGIVKIINKLQSVEAANRFFKQLLARTFQKYQIAINTIEHNHSAYLLPLLEIKTFLQSKHNNQGIAPIDKHLYCQLANKSLVIIVQVIPHCLKRGQKFISYNQLGLCASIFKQTLNICGLAQLDVKTAISAVEQSLVILDYRIIVDMCPFLCLLNEIILAFSTDQNCSLEDKNYFDMWMLKWIAKFDEFFVLPFERMELADTDVIKWFFTIQESLILYSPQLLLRIGHQSFILQKALFALRHINEPKMQRKIINYMLLSARIASPTIQESKSSIFDVVFHSIPIINSASYPNLSKLLLPFLNQINPQQCVEIFYKSLKVNPYSTIPQQIQQILAKTLAFIAGNNQVQNQRYLMMVFKDLRELVVQGEGSQTLMQLEMRLHSWQKQHRSK